jgi:hypothetical protein
MPEYILLLRHANAPCPDLGPADAQAIFQRYNAWAGKTAKAGKLLGGDKFTDRTGRLLTGGGAKGAAAAATEGPCGAAGDVVGGYFKIAAKDYDEAVEVARDCPHLDWVGCTIEIREVDPSPRQCGGAPAAAELSAARA